MFPTGAAAGRHGAGGKGFGDQNPKSNKQRHPAPSPPDPRDPSDPAEWPVYIVPLPHGPVTLQWAFMQESKEDEALVVKAIAAFMADPNYDTNSKGPLFDRHPPAWGIVRAGPHFTSKRNHRPNPYKDFHISVKFSTQRERDRKEGYDYHIYVGLEFQYLPSKGSLTFDKEPRLDNEELQKVYHPLRTKWPPSNKYYSVRHKRFIIQAEAQIEIDEYEKERQERKEKEQREREERGRRDGKGKNKANRNQYDVLSDMTGMP